MTVQNLGYSRPYYIQHIDRPVWYIHKYILPSFSIARAILKVKCGYMRECGHATILSNINHYCHMQSLPWTDLLQQRYILPRGISVKMFQTP